MGVDTVGLKGAPFTIKIENGQEVKAGDEIAEMDLDEIKAKGLDTTIMVLITNSADKISGLDVTEGEAKAGEAVATAYLKDGRSRRHFKQKVILSRISFFYY
jgi:PTS system beta-glucosides-specific IIC component